MLKKSYTFKDVPNLANGVEKSILDAKYKKNADKAFCDEMLEKLAVCTDFIRLGFFTELSEKIDRMKTQINVIYDNILDIQFGKII